MLEVAHRLRHHVDPVIGVVIARGAGKAADQRVEEQILVRVQLIERGGVPAQTQQDECGGAGRYKPVQAFKPEKQAVEPQSGEHRNRRHSEQKMPHPGERRPVHNHFADHRKESGERDQRRFFSPRSCFVALARRGALRQHGENKSHAGAEQQPQRELNRHVGRHVPARNITHLVDVAGQDGLDRIIEIDEIGQPAQRIERRQGRPGPGRDHDQISDDEGSGERKRGARNKGKRLAPRHAPAERRMNSDRDRRVADQKHAEHANAERAAAQHTEQHDQMPARTRQFAADQQQEPKRPHHGRGKRDVLGVVEHRAVPGAAHRKRGAAKSPARGPAMAARCRPHRGDAADAGKRRQQMPDLVKIERKELLEADRDHVKQAAIQIEIPEMKQRLVDKAARVIGDDHLAVTLLHFLVIGDGVVAEGENDEDNQRAEQQQRRDVVTVDARQHAAAPQPNRGPVVHIDKQFWQASRSYNAPGHHRRFISQPFRYFRVKTTSATPQP